MCAADRQTNGFGSAAARAPQRTSYVISAHPYLFDGTFASLSPAGPRWSGDGYVNLHVMGGGVNESWALVEADETGHEALKRAGFQVRIAEIGEYVDQTGRTVIVPTEGGAVSPR